MNIVKREIRNEYTVCGRESRKSNLRPRRNWRDNIEVYEGVDWTGSGLGPIAGLCELDNKPGETNFFGDSAALLS